MSTYTLVLLVLLLGPMRYEVRMVGSYDTRDECERERQRLMSARQPVPSARLLWSECRSGITPEEHRP